MCDCVYINTSVVSTWLLLYFGTCASCIFDQHLCHLSCRTAIYSVALTVHKIYCRYINRWASYKIWCSHEMYTYKMLINTPEYMRSIQGRQNVSSSRAHFATNKMWMIATTEHGKQHSCRAQSISCIRELSRRRWENGKCLMHPWCHFEWSCWKICQETANLQWQMICGN